MDIKIPLHANVQLALNKLGGDGLNLKIGQIIDARVVETQSMLDTLTLKIADKTILVQPDKPLPVENGQPLQLKVIRLLPVMEFKLMQTSPAASLSPTPLPTQNDTWTLKLLNQPLLPQTSNPVELLTKLKTGEQLQARVINSANNQITLQIFSKSDYAANVQTPTIQPPNSYVVTLDTKQLVFNSLPIAKTALPTAIAFKPDTQINLEVIKPGPSPMFEVLPVSHDSEEKILETLKNLLPLQASPVSLLNQLQALLPSIQTDASVAETLKNLAQLILQSTPDKTQLTESTQLKQVVDQSGLFLESKLAELLSGKQDISLQDDFKLKLHKLIQLLHQELAPRQDNKLSESTELLKDSLQKAQSALAKITLDQLQSLPKDDSPKQSWTLELPFFHNAKNESVKIEIERDKVRTEDDQQTNWAVSITITPPGLATIHCKISCYDGSINTRFWSEAADTVDKINAHLDYLKQQFELKGLTSGFMQADQGMPATTNSIKSASIPNLLSEKA